MNDIESYLDGETAETNWQVLTAGPCAGKTALLNYLSAQGRQVVPEAARLYVDTLRSYDWSKEDVEMFREENPYTFQENVARKDYAMEQRLNPEDHLFMDRALDDNDAYSTFNNVTVDWLDEAVQERQYATVFILEQLPFEQDDVRVEDPEAARKIHELLQETYEPYDPITVPVMPLPERAQYVLERVGER